MSRWTDQWREYIKETSYLRNLSEKKISNDDFWRSYGIYDLVLTHSRYPGEMLTKIFSLISSKTTVLDIGAGTGAFSIPLARIASRVVAVEPSEYQLQILMDKARKEGLTNISTIQKYWKETQDSEIIRAVIPDCDISSKDAEEGGIQAVDYSLAAYSFFEEDIEGFLEKMIAVSRKGIFIIFRADVPDSLNEFAYGKRPSADYLCLYNILKEMGHQFDLILFPRNYYLPIELVFRQYRFSERSPEELLSHLSIKGRLQEREDGTWASFSARDALLYLIR